MKARTADRDPARTGSLRDPGAILLVSCYELGRQPLAVASALATLEEAGFEPAAVDLAVDKLTPERIAPAKIAVVSVPMHTAFRIGMRAAETIRANNPGCRTVFFGTYAGLNSDILFAAGADFVVSGEFEEPLRRLIEALDAGGSPPRLTPTCLRKVEIPVPSRRALPALDRYARLEHDGGTVVAGHTETSRGCRHLCRHCSIPPVYGGRFFIVPQDVVMKDIRNQVNEGARHITFGDPDFLNGPGHAMSVARALHADFPGITFDFTAKVEHLLEHKDLLPEFAALGCLFIVSAVESLNDHVLEILDKSHTRRDIEEALALTRSAGITLRPTWVAFTPWTSLADYHEILDFIEREDLIDHVDPVQLTLRLLVPPGSLLVDHPEMKPHLGELDPRLISYRWTHPDPRMDQLQSRVSAIVAEGVKTPEEDVKVFGRIRAAAMRASGREPPQDPSRPVGPTIRSRKRAPRLTEPWFC